MQLKLSEISITPVKSQNGLVAFASFVVNNALYCSSVAILTRPTGGYRLVYPTKQVASRQINIFHPINNQVGRQIEDLISTKYEEVMNYGRNRHCNNHT